MISIICIFLIKRVSITSCSSSLMCSHVSGKNSLANPIVLVSSSVVPKASKMLSSLFRRSPEKVEDFPGEKFLNV